MPIKLFRVAPFALGIPALVTLGLVSAASWIGSRLARGGAVLGALVLVAGLVWASGSPAVSFDEAAAASIGERMTQARIAGRYLEGIPGTGRPVIVVTAGNPRLLDRVVRSAVPSHLIPDTWVFVGRPDDLALGGPVDDPDRPRLTEVAQKWWAAAWPDPSSVLRRDPIVIQIGPPRQIDQQEVIELGPGVAVVDGPEPSPSFEPPPPFGAGWVELLTATGLGLVVLALTGGGWALSLLDVSRLAAFGLAPAFGVATLVLAGTAASRVGVPLSGWGGIGVVLTTAAAGWVSLVLARTASAGRWRTGAEGSLVG
jgi:hypothetical protein